MNNYQEDRYYGLDDELPDDLMRVESFELMKEHVQDLRDSLNQELTIKAIEEVQESLVELCNIFDLYSPTRLQIFNNSISK